MPESLVGFGMLFPLFMMAVVVHEVSHGWTARLLGDPTAFLAGRLSWNPFRHIDPVGTVALPLILLFLHSPFVFGWAKPVPIDPRHLRHPKGDMLWVGAAGPAANFLAAGIASALLKWGIGFLHPVAVELLKVFILINLVLGTFNLLPIPPLDGSRVLVSLLPPSQARWVLGLERWGILLVLILLASGILDRLLWPAVGFLAKMLGLGS